MPKKRTHYGRKISKNFGGILKDWRTRPEVNLTQSQAANKLGLKGKCPAAYLSQIETGKKPVPEVMLLKVPKAYNIPEEEVLKKAYSPQLHLPFLSAMMEKDILWEDIESHLKKLNKELQDDEKKELIRYATFLILKRVTKTK